MCGDESQISFGDLFFIEFASVKICIAVMTNIRFHGSVGFGPSKANPENMFRPKSSRYESRKMSVKHRNSLDSSDNSSDQLLHKRSNSLQSLNSIDTQNNIDERTKLSAKPRRIAWASSKTCSEDKSFEAVETWNPSEVLDQVEPCVEYRNKLEESKKKSIDIFLSRNFIDPMDILPSPRTPRLSLMKSFGSSSFSAAVDKYEPESAENTAARIDEQNSSDGKSEKKVTFAADLSEPNNAEIRRMNFRNSYSKRYSANFSFSSSRLERHTSVSKCPTPKAELVRSAMKRGNSLSSAENTDELTQIACRPTSPSPSPSPSPLFKQPMQPISQQSDKMKQLTIKRKLKSCRSRSFHKSLDNSSVIENFDAFSFTKPLKSNQNSDVVTMVSLIVSNDEDTADPAAHPQSINKSDPTPSVKENIDNKSEKQIKTGILKSKWQSDSIKRVNTQPMQKRRFINVSHKLIASPEKSRTILTAVDNLTKTASGRLNRAHSSDNSNTSSEENDTVAEGKKADTDQPFQSAKEQECWSSFRKMTNKGFSVSFDTILSAHSAITCCTFESRGELTCKLELELCTRTKCEYNFLHACFKASVTSVLHHELSATGLLTPTEYRLRKNELSTQE